MSPLSGLSFSRPSPKCNFTDSNSSVSWEPSQLLWNLLPVTAKWPNISRPSPQYISTNTVSQETLTVTLESLPYVTTKQHTLSRLSLVVQDLYHPEIQPCLTANQSTASRPSPEHSSTGPKSSVFEETSTVPTVGFSSSVTTLQPDISRLSLKNSPSNCHIPHKWKLLKTSISRPPQHPKVKLVQKQSIKDYHNFLW